MQLILLHPTVADRDCDDCRRFVYDEETGRRALRCGRPIARPEGTLPPCGYGPDRCPKGHPAAGRALNAANRKAYRHYQQCRATGRFPDDPIVMRNAGVMYLIEETVKRAVARASHRQLLQILGVYRRG